MRKLGFSGRVRRLRAVTSERIRLGLAAALMSSALIAAPATQARCVKWAIGLNAVLVQPNGWTLHFNDVNSAYVLDTRGVRRISGPITWLKMGVPLTDTQDQPTLSFRLDWADPKLGPWSTIYQLQIMGAPWQGGMQGAYGNTRAYSPRTPTNVISWSLQPQNSVECVCYHSDDDLSAHPNEQDNPVGCAGSRPPPPVHSSSGSARGNL